MPTQMSHRGTNRQVWYQASLQAEPQIVIDISPVGNAGCKHSICLSLGQVCGLCFLRTGFSSELPSRLHLSKTLADNGNPQQTGKLEAHISILEGIFLPKPGQTIKSFSRARVLLGSDKAPSLFPFASAIWDVIGKQPPLGWPLYQAVRGFSEVQIANEMGLSLYNVNERLSKGVKMAAKRLRKYENGSRTSAEARSTAENEPADQEQDGSRRAKPEGSRSRRRRSRRRS